MPDALDQLRHLAGAPPAEPESLEGLRVRVAKRRRRRHGALGGSVALVAAVVLAVVVADDHDGEDVHTVGDPTTTVPPTTDSTDVVGEASLPVPVGSVWSGTSGIEVVSPEGEVVRLWDQPTALAFGLGDGLVVAQAAERAEVYPPGPTGRVLVFEAGSVRELPPGPGEDLRLHDAGVVDGQPVAVVTATTGDGPNDTDERLLLMDLATGARTDLGSVGGWEAGVAQAHLSGGRIVMHLQNVVSYRLQSRAIDGTIEWDVPANPDDTGASIAVAGEQVLLLQTSFEGDDFEPRLAITRIDLATGSEISSESLALQLEPGLAIPGGFCLVAEWAGGELICDRSYGGPVQIDLATGAASRLGSFESGILTLARRSPEASTVVLEREVTGWGGQLLFLVDGSVRAEGFDAWLGENETVSPESAARMLLGLDDGEAQTESDASTATVTLVREVKDDDSVSGVRYVVTFGLRDGRVADLLSAEWGDRCARGTDVTSFAPRPCP